MPPGLFQSHHLVRSPAPLRFQVSRGTLLSPGPQISSHLTPHREGPGICLLGFLSPPSSWVTSASTTLTSALFELLRVFTLFCCSRQPHGHTLDLTITENWPTQTDHSLLSLSSISSFQVLCSPSQLHLWFWLLLLPLFWVPILLNIVLPALLLGPLLFLVCVLSLVT